MDHAVASESQIPHLDRSAKGRSSEVYRARDRLCPDGNGSHRRVGLCPAGDEAMLLDQVASEHGGTITLMITVKHGTEGGPQKSKGVRGYGARPVLHAEVHHAAQEKAKQMEVRKGGGVGKDQQWAHCGLQFRVGHQRQIDQILDRAWVEIAPECLVFGLDLLPRRMSRD